MLEFIQPLETRRLLSGDFNADGNEDLIVRDADTGIVRVMFLNDDEQITGRQFIGYVGGQWEVAAIGDLDDDISQGADILWRNTTTGRLVSWQMNGATRTGFRAFPYANPAIWEFAAGGEHDDLGGPDDMDLLWRNKNTGQLTLWLMDGQNIDKFVQLGRESDANWRIAGMSEVRGDGPVDLEILFRNSQSGANRIWRIDNNVVVGVTSLPPAGVAWRVAGYIDADDDNPGDIIWQNNPTGQLVEWELNDLYAVEDTNLLPNLGPGRTAWIGG